MPPTSLRVAVATALLLTSAACAARAGLECPRPARVRVALCQIAPAGERAAALRAVDAALREAARGGADLAVFPEACLFGWVNPEAHAAADPIPGATVERLGRLAREHGVMLAVGLAERTDAGLHNSVVLLDRDGTLLARHRKVNVLSELMDPPYTPGEGVDDGVVETRFGLIGLLICADTFREDLVDALAARRPDLVLVPYGWAAPPEAWPDHAGSLHAWIANTACRTGAPVVGVDAVGTLGHGPWKGHVLGGQSAVATPDGAVAVVLADRAAEVRVVEVELGDPGLVSRSRSRP